MSRKLLITLIFFSLICVASAAVAEDVVHLSPEKVENMVLERSFGVKQAQMTRDAASESIPEAKGVFDTILSGSSSYQFDKSKQLSPIFGTRTDTVTWGLGLTKELSPTGTTLGLSLDSEWTKTLGALQVNNQPIIPPFGRYEPVLGISLSQPLMQNAFGMLDRGAVKEAKHYYTSADNSIKHEIDKLIHEALMDYWAVFFTRRHLKALERSIAFASEFLHTTLEEKTLGIAEDTDVLAARANLLERKNEYAAYKELERKEEEKLRQDLELEPYETLMLSDRLPPKERIKYGIDAMIAKAFEERGDYLAAIEEVKRQRVRLTMAKNRRWPQLDLVSTLDLNEIDRSYVDALGDMDSPNLTVGLTLQIPLENRAARADARRKEAEKARAVFALKDLENRISNEITQLAETVGKRLDIVETTQETLGLHLEKQKLELGKYSQGRSSSDLVKRYQDDSVLAQRNLFEAWLLYQKSLLDLKLAQGAMVEEAEIIQETDIKP
ncbi:MAG: TolC family protein [Pseudomonadota bacterium]